MKGSDAQVSNSVNFRLIAGLEVGKGFLVQICMETIINKM